MSFRARLFVAIVVVPMAAIGVLMFRLINDSQQGKADARASSVAVTAGSVDRSQTANARADAEMLARDVGSLRGKALSVRFASLATRAGLARATLSSGSTTLVDVGDRTAIAPGMAILRDPAAGRVMTVTVSELTAAQYARDLAAPGVAVLVRRGPKILGSSIAVPNAASLPAGGKRHGPRHRVSHRRTDVSPASEAFR